MIDWLGVFIYLDGAVFDFAIQGKPIEFTFFVALFFSNLQILMSFGIFTGITLWTKKKIYSKINTDTKEFIERLIKWLKKWQDTSLAKRWAERWQKIQRYKYLILFFLNVIPFIPWLTTSTAIAASLSKKKIHCLTAVILGNAIKFFIFIPLYYLL